MAPRRERHPMPDLVARALEDAGLVEAYEARPPYQRNDYLGWIGRAKRDETKQRRLAQMLDELRAGDVYMKMAWGRGAAAGRRTRSSSEPRLLSGGNPQIPRGDGEGPVRAYIEAMPGWKRDVGRALDALVVQTVPDVRKAVRWNSPFYGVKGQGWFLSFHCFAKYVKLTFHRGSALDPPPPGESRHAAVRYFHIHEDEALDDDLLVSWVEQAAVLQGEPLF